MTPELVTIGVYGYDEAGFFQALQDHGVDLLVDIRRRRGVRGSAYAFANRQRLQARLAALGIAYVHRLDLAPSAETRGVQATADKASRTARRQRAALDPAFVQAYTEQCLDGLDSRQLIEELGQAGQVVALLCVEREPAACHRALLAERLHADLGIPVRHLLPADNPKHE